MGVTGVIVTPSGSNRLQYFVSPTTGLWVDTADDNRPETQDHAAR